MAKPSNVYFHLPLKVTPLHRGNQMSWFNLLHSYWMKRKNSEKFGKSKALQEGSGTSKQPLLTRHPCAGEQEGGNSAFRSSLGSGLAPISF